MEPIPPVEQRPLGSQGLVSSAQGLGAMGMTAFYKATSPGADEAECMRTFARALELGINFIDTAWIYQSHDGSETNEELVVQTANRKVVHGTLKPLLLPRSKLGGEHQDDDFSLEEAVHTSNGRGETLVNLGKDEAAEAVRRT